MRQLLIPAVAAIAVAGLWIGQAHAGNVEVKDVHMCCNQCVKIINGLLDKVDGVSGAKPDRETRTVSFTAKDNKAASAGVKALLDAGFFGTATEDGKALKVDVATPKKGDKANEVTVKAVHVCCKICQKEITGLFKDNKVEFAGTAPLREVKISGKDLEKSAVMETLRKAGFNGTAQ